MRRYETIFIADPDLSDEERGQLFERSKELISTQDGFLVTFDEWGNKKLAYEIRKKNRGYYVRLDYCGSGPLVEEMERNFRIDDRVLKFMTILLDDAADIEKLKEEALKAKEDLEEKATDSDSEEKIIESSEENIPEEEKLVDKQVDDSNSQTEIEQGE